jgi:hypothetical protein
MTLFRVAAPFALLAGFRVAALLALLAGPADAQVGAPAPDPDAARLCANQDPCRVAQRSDAGRGADGSALAIVELTLGETNAEGQPCRDNRRQFWLLAEGTPPRQLLDLCNDGYGAAGMGEDEIAITPNQLVYTQAGGSNWRWEVGRTVRLSPLAVVSERTVGWWTVGSNSQARTWDWTRLTGNGRWWAPPCPPPGQQMPDDQVEAPDPLPYEYTPIPRVDADAMPGALGAELGSCALQIDAGGTSGFVINGAADAAAASREWLRVLQLGDHDVLITVGAGPWHSGAASWIHDDHLELWLSSAFGYGTHCLGADERPSQWGIRIADGRLSRGVGPDAHRPRIVARRERRDGSGTIVTFHLRLAEQTHGFTAVLARGDGQRQGRMIATARVRFGQAGSVGEAVYLPSAGLRCAVRDGRLDVVETGRVEMLRGDN